MRHGLVAGLVVAVGGIGLGAEPKPAAPDHAGAAKLAAAAVEKLTAGGVPGFLDVAFSGDDGSMKKADRAGGEGGLTRLHDAAVARYGKPTGVVEPVRTETLGQSLVRFVYLERLERGGLVWHLTFYRGDGGWRWSAFNMGDALGGEFRPAKVEALDKDLLALARAGADGLTAPGVTKLLDALYADGKSLMPIDRAQAEPRFVAVRGNVAARDGKPLGEVELLRAEVIGDSFARLTYLEKCERGGPVWKFVFYRTPDGWKWQNADIGEHPNEFGAPK